MRILAAIFIIVMSGCALSAPKIQAPIAHEIIMPVSYYEQVIYIGQLQAYIQALEGALMQCRDADI